MPDNITDEMSDEEIEEAIEFSKKNYEPEDFIPIRFTVAPKGDPCWRIVYKE
jgi:hypothetical protein